MLIPLSSCDKAAEKLIEWFDPDELKQVVGGERWWQVRGLDGLEAEWVTEKKFMLPVDVDKVQSVKHNMQLERDLTGDEMEILGMEHLDKVMVSLIQCHCFWISFIPYVDKSVSHQLYIHGGT